MSYVLQEMIAAKQGRTTYFRQMTGIGPMGTSDIAEAAVFPSREEAERSPAALFWLTAYRPVNTEGLCQACEGAET